MSKRGLNEIPRAEREFNEAWLNEKPSDIGILGVRTANDIIVDFARWIVAVIATPFRRA